MMLLQRLTKPSTCALRLRSRDFALTAKARVTVVRTRRVVSTLARVSLMVVPRPIGGFLNSLATAV